MQFAPFQTPDLISIVSIGLARKFCLQSNFHTSRYNRKERSGEEGEREIEKDQLFISAWVILIP